MKKTLLIKILLGLWEFTKTILLPAAIFFAGLFFADIIRKKEKRESQEELKKYFYTIADLECKLTKDQVIEYDKCAERIKLYETINVTVRPIIGLPIDAYNAINKKDLFFAYSVNQYRNLPYDFSNIITHFESINNAHLEITSSDNKFVKTVTPLIIEFNTHNINFRNILLELFNNFDMEQKTFENDKFLVDLGIIWGPFRDKEIQDNDFNINVVYNELVLKLLDFTSKTKDPRKNQLVELLMPWNNCCEQLIVQYDTYYTFLINRSATLEKASTQIMSSLLFLNNPPSFDMRF
ncbi:MAG: hypothetical protein QM504_10970 [Pseudomonadota bacterium]